jgi:ribosome biogenesis GTPase
LSGQGIPELETDLTDKVSIFTGQSGVGKSSLTQLLLPDKDIRINAISETTKHGRHTTTAATLFHLANGGDLIDSPGVSIFGLSDLDTGQIAQGYREFQPYISNCQFNDCKHLIDKGCAVRDAVEAGMIDSSRYQRYQKLVHKMIS